MADMDTLRAWANHFCLGHGYSLEAVLAVNGRGYKSLWGVKKALAKSLREAGYSYASIGILLGCQPSTAEDLVKGRRKDAHTPGVPA